MQITKFLMVETGTYNPMVTRPYKSHADGEVSRIFANATRDGTDLSASALNGVAGSIIKPAAQPNGYVNIVNGWDQKRFRFLLEVTNQMGYGFGNREIICGYSDHYGVSVSGFIDPNMRLYFNNAIVIRDVGVNGVIQSTMGESAQILMPPTLQPMAPIPSDTLAHSMRPEDVVAAMSAALITDGECYDARTSFVGGPKKAMRAHAVAPKYVSKVMTGLSRAINDPDNNAATSGAQIYNNARNSIADSRLVSDDFFRKLTDQTAYLQQGFITYSELCRIFPEADSQCVWSPASAVTRSGIPVATQGQGEYWQVSTTEAVIATILAQAVPSIMMDLMITKLIITATNETLDGSIFVGIEDPAAFTDGIDMRPYIAAFEQRIINEVLFDISTNNRVNFRLKMSANVVGESRIMISYASQPIVEFIIPSFCDALMSPVVTNNAFDLRTVAHTLDCLYNNVAPSQYVAKYNEYTPPTPYNQMQPAVQQPMFATPPKPPAHAY